MFHWKKSGRAGLPKKLGALILVLAMVLAMAPAAGAAGAAARAGTSAV